MFNMVRKLLIIALFIGLMPLVSASDSCYVSSGACSGDYVNVFNVTDAGHFAEPGYSVSLYRFCCPSMWTGHGSGTEPSFLYSNLGTDSSGYKQGLVQNVSIGNFPNEFFLAENIEGCRVEPVGYNLVAGEFCIFRMNHADERGARITGCEDDLYDFYETKPELIPDGEIYPVCADSIGVFCYFEGYDGGETSGDILDVDTCSRWDGVDWEEDVAEIYPVRCYSSLPMTAEFQYKLVCEAVEICHDSIDNTGDGLIDCASPTCNPMFGNPEPMECTGNNQTTADCLENPDHCRDNDGNSFYCSYGEDDDPNTGEGYCCPAGQYAFTDPVTGDVTCEDFDQCGVEVEDICNFDFDDDRSDWLSSIYDGVDEDNWCSSQLPYLDPTAAGAIDGRSDACCEIEKYGTTDYFLDEQNVRIFG